MDGWQERRHRYLNHVLSLDRDSRIAEYDYLLWVAARQVVHMSPEDVGTTPISWRPPAGQ